MPQDGCHGVLMCPRMGVRDPSCPRMGVMGLCEPQEGHCSGWGAMGTPGRTLSEVTHHHRAVHAPRRVTQRMGHCRVHGKGVTEDGVAQGLCVTQEGHCRTQGIAGPVDAPGRVSQGTRHHVCSRKGVVEAGVAQGPSTPQEGCHVGQGITGSFPPWERVS